MTGDEGRRLRRRQPPLLGYTSTSTPQHQRQQLFTKNTRINNRRVLDHIYIRWIHIRVRHIRTTRPSPSPPSNWQRTNTTNHYTGKGRTRHGEGKGKGLQGTYKELQGKIGREGGARREGSDHRKRVYPIFYFCSLVL
jgi:hypothetical protein